MKKDEREKNQNLNSSPVFGDGGKLIPEIFNISGNSITAYYDSDHKLVFVLDSQINDKKPNVLLVINSVGDRKWDDILANDFNMNLENVRPKKDNKYQKLDIEYDELSVYDNLINNFKSGSYINTSLSQLAKFRDSAVHRSANDRLKAAESVIEKTNETIVKTNETLTDLNARLKGLKTKLAEQRKKIGKEPTKQSASKILRTEAYIDNINGKIKRAKKRLLNAEKRLQAAKEEVTLSRDLLNKTSDEYVPIILKDTEPKKEVMVEEKKEEIKPLFDKDPNILDDKIAFKPIDFSSDININNNVIAEPEKKQVFEPIEIPVIKSESEPLAFVPPEIYENKPIIEKIEPIVAPVENEIIAKPIENIIPSVVVEPAPVINVVPEPEMVRPASPINIVGEIKTISGEEEKRRPTAMYYFMLLILIVLSVFTLWMYQKKTVVNNVPDLTVVEKPQTNAPVAEEPDVIPTELQPVSAPTPFIDAEENIPVEQPVVEEPVAEEPQPVEEIPTVFQEPEPVMEQPVSNEPEEPIYNVSDISQNPPPPEDNVSDAVKPEYEVSGHTAIVQ